MSSVVSLVKYSDLILNYDVMSNFVYIHCQRTIRHKMFIAALTIPHKMFHHYITPTLVFVTTFH